MVSMGWMPSSIRARLDGLGIMLSCLCAAHCLTGIVVVAVLGWGGGLLLHPDFHRVGLALAAILAAGSIGLGAWRYRRWSPFLVALGGLVFMGGALAVGHGLEEMVLTVVGVALVASGHMLNLRLGRAAEHGRAGSAEARRLAG